MECLPSGPLQTNTYLLYSANEAVVVDPAPGSAEKIVGWVLKTKKKLLAVWITHSHWDHVADACTISDTFSIPVRVHRFDADNMISPGIDGLPSWVSVKPVPAPVLLVDGEQLRLGDEVWTVFHTPGHSLGGVCFYNAQSAELISGDTLFRGTMGKVSFPTSDPESMKESLRRLSELPEETRVYPGHGPSTTIGAERSWMRHFADG